jgi:hypothetical protein
VRKPPSRAKLFFSPDLDGARQEEKLASPLASVATYGFFIVLFAKKLIHCALLILSSRFSI